MSEEEKGTGFKVVDKRRFDSAGNERDQNKELPPRIEPEKDKATDFVVKENVMETSNGNDSSDVALSGLFISLANQALWYLGVTPPPEGMQVEKDLVAAKELIDMLGALDKKTKGNLDSVEAKLLEEILHNLRIQFLRAK